MLVDKALDTPVSNIVHTRGSLHDKPLIIQAIVVVFKFWIIQEIGSKFQNSEIILRNDLILIVDVLMTLIMHIRSKILKQT